MLQVPTGYLHIGGVRTALFNWLLARQAGGQFILRIDDTDKDRHVEAALQPILDGFRWLGIDWDEGPEVGGPHGPYFQSQRAEIHQDAVQQLLASGHAYRDYSGSDYQAEREAAEKAKQPFVYSRQWMAETDEQAQAFEAEGRRAVVRLKMPREGTCRFVDHVRGEVEVEWANEPDTVIQRTDGSCLYQLATVVDDHAFEITHVVRAVEHLSNTPRQIFIYQSLGYDIPEFAHIPFVAEPSGTKKISKRETARYMNDKAFRNLCQLGNGIAETLGMTVEQQSFNPVLIEFYRVAGFLPAAMLNYLLLLGWSLDDKTEDFSVEEMTKEFSLARVVKSPASFDPSKLQSFQSRYMNDLPVKQKVAMLVPVLQQAEMLPIPTPCESSELLTAIVEAAGDRLKITGDVLEYVEFFVDDDQLEFDQKAFQKRVRAEGAPQRLTAFRQVLADAEQFDVESLDKLMHDFCESQGIKIGEIIHAVRVAVTGRAKGLGMFDCLAILGRERCLARIDRALAAV